MQDIFKFFIKYSFTIIFILLEFIAFSLIVSQNVYQRNVFLSSSLSSINKINSIIKDVKNYMDLKEQNEELFNENVYLKNEIENFKESYNRYKTDSVVIDSINTHNNYIYYSANVINASINKDKNYITINKGTKDGITADMAVCIHDMVVGIVVRTSSNYSIVAPLINTNLRVSAKIKKNGHYGSLQWNGRDYRYSYLNDIPFHVEVNAGDTVVTSGYSAIFPEGKIIGYVEEVSKQTANFLKVKLQLASDFNSLSQVYVIGKDKQEQVTLEEGIK